MSVREACLGTAPLGHGLMRWGCVRSLPGLGCCGSGMNGVGPAPHEHVHERTRPPRVCASGPGPPRGREAGTIPLTRGRVCPHSLKLPDRNRLPTGGRGAPAGHVAEGQHLAPTPSVRLSHSCTQSYLPSQSTVQPGIPCPPKDSFLNLHA